HPLTFDFFARKSKQEPDVRTRICVQDFGPGTWRRMIHELGHAYYFMAYGRSLNLYKMSPNAAVHEAIGEAMFLLQNGCRFQERQLQEQSQGRGKVPELINRLLKEALTSFVRIPYGLSLELWRFEAMTGKRPKDPETLNQRYWEIRE